MTLISRRSSLSIGENRPIDPVATALLRHVSDAARHLNTEFVVAGATARDFLLWHVHGIRAERATRDVDIAVCAVSWEAHTDLIARLVATGLFNATNKEQQSLTFHDPKVGRTMPLDLVPFGQLEAPEGSIAWPPGGEIVMNVLGFREAVDTSIDVDLKQDLSVPVVILPALALLKLLAWHDRHTWKNTDVSDLHLILRTYYHAGNQDRLWEVGADLLQAYDFNVDLASAALLGREASHIALPATSAAAEAILQDDRRYEMLRRDMAARAAARLFEEFVDASDEVLAAFRRGFLSARRAD